MLRLSLVRIAVQLHARGIKHGSLVERYVLISSNGDLVVIDFGQAVRHHCWNLDYHMLVDAHTDSDVVWDSCPEISLLGQQLCIWRPGACF